jgi:hypothetical protein
VSKIAGAEVLIFRKHAYVALPDDEYTLRYEVSPNCAAIIKLNDEGRFNEIPQNVTMVLRPPTKSRRLVAMRANAKKNVDHYKTNTGRTQAPSDPYSGIWRNGVNAPS